MNVFAASRIAQARRAGNGRRPALQTATRAWNRLSWRHWLIAAGVGVLMGAVDGTFMFLYIFKNVTADPKVLAAWPDMLVIMLTHFVLLMAGVACALAFALALLREVSRRSAIRPRVVAVTIFAVATFGSLIVDPISLGATAAVHTWLHFPSQFFWEGAGDWLTALSRMYSNSGEKVLTFVATVTLSAVYYLKDTRTSDALAIAQMGLSRAQKRRLTEELRSAQAALDPQFLFATFDEVDRRFESEPRVAEKLLEALIGYLRAALPADDDAIGTLGQQATLVRAYLETHSIRSAGRVQAQIEVPSELDTRPFAPALILPLVVLVAGDAAAAGCAIRIRVKASVVDSRLSVEVRGDGFVPRRTAEEEATLASLRRRLSALYGGRAELSFVMRASEGSIANIVIDDPGSL